MYGKASAASRAGQNTASNLEFYFLKKNLYLSAYALLPPENFAIIILLIKFHIVRITRIKGL
jgi:hypothetical protein